MNETITQQDVGVLTVGADGDLKIEPQIVSGTMASANALGPAGREVAQAIEAAMSDAILEAARQGIVDPVKIRAAMMAARAQVNEAWRRERMNRQNMARDKSPRAVTEV